MTYKGYTNFHFRTIINAASGGIVRLPALFDGINGKKIFLMSDKGLEKVGIVKRIEEAFLPTAHTNAPKIVGKFLEITSDAGSNSINLAIKAFKDCDADAILAVGGGSVLDAAKAVKYARMHNEVDITRCVKGGVKFGFWPNAKPSTIPHIAVPTTAGTGAEVSPVSVIYDENVNLKVNLVTPYIEADIAVLDPDLTVGLPANLTANTGMDALSHAIEALSSPSATIFTDALGKSSASLIEQNLEEVTKNGKNIDARNSMLQASTMSIVAFCNALGPVPIHNIAHAFGALYHIPHGDAISATMPVFMAAFPEYYYENAHKIADALNIFSNTNQTMAISKEEALNLVINRIKKLQSDSGSRKSFKDLKIPASDYEKIFHGIVSDAAAILFKIPHPIIDKVIKDLI